MSTADRPFASLTDAEIAAKLYRCTEMAAAVKTERTALEMELGMRFGAALAGVYATKGKQFGTEHIETPEGLVVTGVIEKKVDYDSDKLMPTVWDLGRVEAEKIFKLKASVPEKVYAAIAADQAQQNFRAVIDAARTVTPTYKPLSIRRKD